MREAAERLEAALGHEVKLRRRAGELVAEIHFDELDEVETISRSIELRRSS